MKTHEQKIAEQDSLMPDALLAVMSPNKAQHSLDDDGKISREDWRDLALSRYERMEYWEAYANKIARQRDELHRLWDTSAAEARRNKAHAVKLAEALQGLLDENTGWNRTKAAQALSAYEAAQ